MLMSSFCSTYFGQNFTTLSNWSGPIMQAFYPSKSGDVFMTLTILSVEVFKYLEIMLCSQCGINNSKYLLQLPSTMELLPNMPAGSFLMHVKDCWKSSNTMSVIFVDATLCPFHAKEIWPCLHHGIEQWRIGKLGPLHASLKFFYIRHPWQWIFKGKDPLNLCVQIEKANAGC